MDIEIVKTTEGRPTQVLQRVQEIKGKLVVQSLELGRLLKEIKEGGYHLDYGFNNFGDWVESAGLDLSERSAYYLIQVVDLQDRHDIANDVMEAIGISKLKQIASMPDDTEKETIDELLDAAQTSSHEQIKEVVAELKGNDHVIKTFKLDREFSQTLLPEAFERVRRMTAADSSDGRCLELIVADFLAQVVVEEPQDEYRKLVEFVMERDGYKCRVCGSRQNLQGHHVVFRSHGGQDTPQNLLTTCLDCHESIHKYELALISWFGDAALPVTYQKGVNYIDV